MAAHHDISHIQLLIHPLFTLKVTQLHPGAYPSCHRVKIENKPWTGHLSITGHTLTPKGQFGVSNQPKDACF